MDFARRAHDHNYKMDPIVRSRLDNDFYIYTMGQVIHEKHPNVQVTFGLTNRSKDIRLIDHFSLEELKEQLDHARTLKYTQSELIVLQGQTYYGVKNMFKPAYINSLATSRLPEYEITINKTTGQYDITTAGNWGDVKDWEIHALAIVNELYARSQMRKLSKSQLDIMYARAKVRLYAKLEKIKNEAPELPVSEFGTRRRHGFLWQKWVVETMMEVLGKQFLGTSNVLISQMLGIEAKGTNAHQMPMVYAALAPSNDDEALFQSQYKVLQDWQTVYGEHLRIFLPDTFGTTQFLDNAPSWVQWWNGYRPDSKDPIEAGDEAIKFWERMGQDPKKKLCLFADGLDVGLPGEKLNGHDMIAVHNYFKGRINDSYGWGTNATNSFHGCVPGEPDMMKALSIVMKPIWANGRATVKISDNPAKAKSEDLEELARYYQTFGKDGIGEYRATKV